MRCAWLVTAAACTSVPDEPVRDSAPVVRIGTDAGTIQVHAKGFDLGFAPAPMVRMPESLTVGGSTNLLDGQDCPFESYIGVALFPAYVASAQVPAVASTIVRIADGPVIAKLGVTYDVSNSCAGIVRHLTGTTFFTIYPTGRINREDRMISPTTTELPAAAACEPCGSPPATTGPYYFTSYYTIASTMYVNSAGVHVDDAPLQGCALRDDGLTVGISWRADNVGVGPRFQNEAYTHDWVREDTGAFEPQVRGAFSDLAVPARAGLSCADVLEVARDVPLIIGGSPVVAGNDGIYRPEGARRGTTAIAFANPASDAAFAHGFAVSMDLGTVTHLKLTRGGAVSTAFRLQPDPEDSARTIVWFEDGLGPDDALALEVD